MVLDSAPGTDITVFGVNGDDESCIGTMNMTVRDHLNAATVESMLHTDWTFVPSGKYVNRNIIQGNILTLQRNEAVHRMKGDWLLFIDDDMVWRPEDIGRLIQSRDELDLDILGGLCYRRSAPHQPTLYMREQATSGAYNYLEEWKDDVVEVDATGLAFAVIHKRVFEAIAASPMPPYDERIASGSIPNFFRWEGVLGEDLRFCQEAKAAGCRVFVDTRIEIGHMAEIEIRRKHYLLELLGRDAETTLARRAINDKMGLPTMTENQVRQRLGWS